MNGKAGLRILRADSGIHPLGGDFTRAIGPAIASRVEFERVDSGYVPKDSDCVHIIFGPPEDVPVSPDRTIIDLQRRTARCRWW